MAGKKVPVPRYKVLSGRVSDEEYEAIEKLAKKDGKTVSDVVRMVMTEWQRSRK